MPTQELTTGLCRSNGGPGGLLNSSPEVVSTYAATIPPCGGKRPPHQEADTRRMTPRLYRLVHGKWSSRERRNGTPSSMHTRSLLKYYIEMKFPFYLFEGLVPTKYSTSHKVIGVHFVPTCHRSHAIHGLGNKNNSG